MWVLHLQVNTFFKYWLNTCKYYLNTYKYCHNTCEYWAGEYTLRLYTLFHIRAHFWLYSIPKFLVEGNFRPFLGPLLRMRSPKNCWVVRCLPSFWHVLFINGQQGGSQNNMALPKGMKMRLLWISPYLAMRLCSLVELCIHFRHLELLLTDFILTFYQTIIALCWNWTEKARWELSY